MTKRKLDSEEAARAASAAEAGVERAEVQMAGLKDRQGLTIQYMSVARGREVHLADAELKIEPAGFAAKPLAGEDSLGNAFELTVRALSRDDLHRLRTNLPRMRAHGTLNYFDDQRFGNLTHGQGWICEGLCLGETGRRLRRLLGAPSPRDDERHRRFKEGLERHWGDWRECRDDAGRFGAHHSVFEHLAKSPERLRGRLRARGHAPAHDPPLRLAVAPVEPRAGRARARAHPGRGTRGARGRGGEPARLPRTHRRPRSSPRRPCASRASASEDVTDPDARRLYERVLANEELAPERMAVEVKGFHLKGEEREVFVRPTHLRVRPPEFDNLNPGLWCVRVRFELPRGSYATLVVKRLFAGAVGEAQEVPPPERRGPPPPQGERRAGTRTTGRAGGGEREHRTGRGRDRGLEVSMRWKGSRS